MRDSQTNRNSYPKDIFLSIADSLKELVSVTGVPPEYQASEVLRDILNRLGANLRSICYGKSGQQSCEMIARSNDFFLQGIPLLADLLAGTNDFNAEEPNKTCALGSAIGSRIVYTDPGGRKDANAWMGNEWIINSGPGAPTSNIVTGYYFDKANNRGVLTLRDPLTVATTTSTNYTIKKSTQANIQANLQGLIKCLKYVVTGGGKGTPSSYYSQNDLPANAAPGQRMLVYHDTSSNGGILKNHPAHHATITDNMSASPQQTVWEFRSIQGGEKGWGRVATNTTIPWGCKHIMLTGAQYLNFLDDTIYDSFNPATGLGHIFADYATLRLAQQAAVAAENVLIGGISTVIYIDAWTAQACTCYDNNTFLGRPIQKSQEPGSSSMYILPGTGNRHHNIQGHAECLARPQQYTIEDTDGWPVAIGFIPEAP